MVIPINIREIRAAQPGRHVSVVETRQRALRRLYQRQVAIDDLIRTLETYQQAKKAGRVDSIKPIARCS
jgi:hypothetical protein